MSAQKRVEEGGYIGRYQSVNSVDGSPLECFTCRDESLYHDSFAYWNESGDDLLCHQCYERKDGENRVKYLRVLTQH